MPKYSPQYTIPKHHQSPFLRQFEGLLFPSIENNRQNYSFLYIFGWQPQRHKILHWLIYALIFFANRILMRQDCSQISGLFHQFKRTIIDLHIVTLSCILISRHDHVLRLPTFNSSSVSSLTTTKDSVFFFTVYTLPPKILTST